MTENSDNCYWVGFSNLRKTKLCNVVEQVMLAWPINGGNLQGFMNVHVQFLGKTDGSFSADSMLEPIIKLFKKTASKDSAQVQGWPEHMLEIRVTAQDAKCFRIGTNYIRDAPCMEPNPQDCKDSKWPATLRRRIQSDRVLIEFKL
jgi:hypothetical protein